ncbi:uncharacterized protein [Diabrotica undecimpunctata]|uniref:uncharacterized protein n=1 Tax=Diabrotica undecimpunctata TaxID=50387 RepID=UPI003B642621
MAETAKYLRAKRAAKTNIIRIANVVSSNEQGLSNCRIREYITQLRAAYKSYLDALENLADDETILESEEVDITYEKYMDALCYLEEKLERIEDSLSSNSLSGQGSSHSTSTAANSRQRTIRLPELKINKFSGNLHEFPSFFQTFNSIIDADDSLTDIEKFIYLKSLLTHDALKVVDNIPLSGENYSLVRETLEKRYTDHNLIVKQLITNIVDTKSLQNNASYSQLKDFTLAITNSYRALNNLDLSSKELLNLILIHITSSKLDHATLRSIEFSPESNKIKDFNQFLTMVDDRAKHLENLYANSKAKHQPSKETRSSFHISTDKNKPPSQIMKAKVCSYCKLDNHSIYLCQDFKSLSASSRRNFVQQNSLCSNCLGTRHRTIDCISRYSCSNCNRRHHSLLHSDSRNREAMSTHREHSNSYKSSQTVDAHVSTRNRIEPHASTSSSSHDVVVRSTSPSTHAVSAVSTSAPMVLLGTVQAYLIAPNGKREYVKVLLDPASQLSFVSKNLLKKIAAPTYKNHFKIHGIAQSISNSTLMSDLTIFSAATDTCIKIKCSVLDSITTKLPQVPISINKLNLPTEVVLADPNFYSPSEVDILLAADICADILTGNIIQLGPGLPILQGSSFGHIVSGRIPDSFIRGRCSKSQYVNNLVTCVAQSFDMKLADSVDLHLTQIVQRFWEIEDIPLDRKVSVSQYPAEIQFIKSVTILNTNRYQVNIGLKTNRNQLNLGNTFLSAKKRFLNLEKKLHASPQLLHNYSKIIQDYAVDDKITQIPLKIQNSQYQFNYFLPHFPVKKAGSSGIRIVFDPNNKVAGGQSLNEVLDPGYTCQPELFDILLTFRQYTFVLIADISNMYMQIMINPEETFLLNFLWRDHPDEPIRAYQLKRLPFGLSSSPFLATRVLKHIADSNQTTHPVASHTIKNYANIDNIVTSANNLERLHILYSQLRSLLNIHGFQLYKIYLNSRAFSNEHNMIFTSEVNLDLDSSFSKVLGINRSPYQDDFFKLPICEEAPPLTKRKLCTYVSRMYNSLGKLLSFRVHSKSFLQLIWSLPLDWYSDILDDLLIPDWKSLLDTFQSISKIITFPRCLTLPLPKSDMQLHCFTDASQDIYAACVYLRVVYSDNTVTSRLIASKTRIAPLKNKLTIPRLELSGILLGVTLTRKVLEVLSKNVTISEVHIFSDSLIALTWILTTKFTWNPFVLHRVSQIKELSKSFLFHHVSSSLNVADLPSRASDITQSNLKKLWTEGPPFLVSSVIDYSQFRIKEWMGDLLELRHTQVTLSTTSDISQVNNTLETLFNKCSSFSKIQRTLAYVFRFLSNLRKRHTNSPLELGPLQVCEISSSTTVIVKYIQSQAFPKEFHELKHRKIISDKTIRALNPFLSEKTGLLHVGGRLEFAPISFEQKHPLLLPTNHSVVKLMIKQMHVKLEHAGALTTLSNFRSKYWPISGLRQTKKIIHDCVKCFRFMTPKSTQLMADLHPDRVLSTRPFQKVSVDYGGFFMIRSSHLRKAPLYKAYIAFFICMTTKCVHIELVTGLTADAFILTLKRFIARRSAPEIIWSDNATNFYGARNQLLELNELFKGFL